MGNRNSENKHHPILATVALASIPVAFVSLANRKFKKIFKVDRSYLNQDILSTLPDEFTINAYETYADQNLDWYKGSNLIHQLIDSFDGYVQDGVLIKNHDNHKYVLLAHDYGQDRYALLHQAHLFDDLGFNVLMVDLRGWGDSESEYTTLGFKESLDILAWVNALKQYDELSSVGLYGVGLGAASVILAAEHLNETNLSFVISDCAYASIIDEIEYLADSKLYTSLICSKVNNVLNFNLDDVKILDSVAKIDVPTLFIHGEKDVVVPCQNTLALYENCNAKKELLIIEESQHGYNCYRDGYKECIQNFIENL